MIVDTKRRIWAFSISVTFIALIAAEVLNLILFPAELWPYTLRATAIIVPVITIPICLWIGGQMRDKALMSLELQALVDRDRLTDVATRDFFFSRLKQDPDAYGASLMIDIDHFKRVNDTHGHLAGDRVIHDVAQVVRAQIRDKDIVCRFGGEEFVVFLHQANAQESWTIAERIRTSAAVAITATADGEISVTVSVGGSMKDSLEDVETAIKRADACLYRAKAQGRNRTVVDWDEAHCHHSLAATVCLDIL